MSRESNVAGCIIAGKVRLLAIPALILAALVSGCGGGGSASHLSASTRNVNFGSVDVGSTNSQLVTVTNESVTNVNVSAATSGAGFAVSGAANTALAPQQSLDLYVSFNPTAAGSASGSLSITSTASPTPLNIRLSGKGSGSGLSVVLDWNPSTSSSIVGYNVYRSTQGPNSYSKLNSSASPSTSYTDSSVTGNTTYYYAVTSVNSSNEESGYSNQVSVTTPGN